MSTLQPPEDAAALRISVYASAKLSRSSSTMTRLCNLR